MKKACWCIRYLLCGVACFVINNSSAFLGTLFEELGVLSEFNSRNCEAVVRGVKALMLSPDNAKDGVEKVSSPDPLPCTFDTLPGMPLELREIVDFFNHAERFRAVGARVPRGVLLYGPPGTGKTSVARVLAHECKAEFFPAKGSEFIEIYVGVGPKRVRELFDKARACERAIVFIDEIDSIGARRDRSINSESASTLNELLSQMDGFVQMSHVLVVAATNRLDMLDPALLRPGRFDRIVYVGLPDKNTRRSIVEYYTTFISSAASDKVFDTIATQSEGLSGADLKNLVNEAAVRAARRGVTQVVDDDFMVALADIKRGGGGG